MMQVAMLDTMYSVNHSAFSVVAIYVGRPFQNYMHRAPHIKELVPPERTDEISILQEKTEHPVGL